MYRREKIIRTTKGCIVVRLSDDNYDCNYCQYRHGGCPHDDIKSHCKEFLIGKCYSCKYYWKNNTGKWFERGCEIWCPSGCEKRKRLSRKKKKRLKKLGYL